MARYEFTVVIEKDEDGMYVAEVPDLKGCYTQGATLEEVLKNVREVIELCLETQKSEIRPHELVGVQKIEISA
ncbi:MAG: type II toxin-antitoxin system HicB family antitoxin [Candidatus Aenigmarchaeota archaeon]|nr:type II toxin-antitoxin system HicB family antitoxin [Candidatus Aenigmarchaeota archaeon]